MAIRPLVQLKTWFIRGAYPKAEQFADWMDSFWHKTDDKIPISSVDELAGRLNDKYNVSEAVILEAKTDKVIADLVVHEKETAQNFENVFESIEELEAEDVKINAAIVVINTDIDNLQAVDVEIKKNITNLQAVDKTLQISLTNAHTDIGKIREMLKTGATLDQAKAALLALGQNYKDVYSVANTLKTFLEASDTSDSTINRWQEIESFLTGITDNKSLTDLLSQLEQKVTTAYNLAIAAAVKVETDRAKLAEGALSRNIGDEQTRAETAEDDLGARITNTKTELVQTDGEIRKDIAALRQTVLGILAESAGRVIPLAVEIIAPLKIINRNPISPYFKVKLLPSFAVQNVMYLSDDNAVSVEPDGEIIVHKLGKSRVHVIPTENTALHRTIEVEVIEPSMILLNSTGALRGNDILFLLT